MMMTIKKARMRRRRVVMKRSREEERDAGENESLESLRKLIVVRPCWAMLLYPRKRSSVIAENAILVTAVVIVVAVTLIVVHLQ
jgi:hypothetical protein